MSGWFKIHNNRGFQVKFSNNIIMSVMFDGFSYCKNKGIESLVGNHGSETLKCENAEVAFINDETQEFLTMDIYKTTFEKELNDDVVGYVSSDDLAKMIKTATMWWEDDA